MSNSNLKNAKKAKNDEFYTQYVDIEKELQYYDFSGKSIYCNCDNPHHSNFYKYFKDNFQKLKLKGLISTFYSKEGKSFVYRFDGLKETKKGLNGNGSYDSEECLKLLEECDVVVTNPPFSLFREYVKLLMDYNKKFLIIGNKNAVTYKEIFPYIKNNELCLGNTIPNEYYLPNGDITKTLIGLCRWFTNIPHIKQNKPLILTKKYNPIDYPQYDNYMAINVDKVKDIPSDYDGVMGVPITFLQYYNPKQFEILDARDYTNIDKLKYKSTYLIKDKDGIINGKPKYARILIKKNDSLEPVEFEILGITENADYLKSLYINGCQKYDRPYINGKRIYSRLLIKRKQVMDTNGVTKKTTNK